MLLAAANGHTAALRRLLNLGAAVKVDLPAHGGTTPACAAAARGHSEALAILDETGADLHLPGSAGATPLEHLLRRALMQAGRASIADSGGRGNEGCADSGGGGGNSSVNGATPDAARIVLEAAASKSGDACGVSTDAAGSDNIADTALLAPARANTNGHSQTSACLAALIPVPPPATLVRLIDQKAEHPGAGSCYIDGGVPEAVRAPHPETLMASAPQLLSSSGPPARVHVHVPLPTWCATCTCTST